MHAAILASLFWKDMQRDPIDPCRDEQAFGVVVSNRYGYDRYNRLLQQKQRIHLWCVVFVKHMLLPLPLILPILWLRLLSWPIPRLSQSFYNFYVAIARRWATLLHVPRYHRKVTTDMERSIDIRQLCFTQYSRRNYSQSTGRYQEVNTRQMMEPWAIVYATIPCYL